MKSGSREVMFAFSSESVALVVTSVVSAMLLGSSSASRARGPPGKNARIRGGSADIDLDAAIRFILIRVLPFQWPQYMTLDALAQPLLFEHLAASVMERVRAAEDAGTAGLQNVTSRILHILRVLALTPLCVYTVPLKSGRVKMNASRFADDHAMHLLNQLRNLDASTFQAIIENGIDVSMTLYDNDYDDRLFSSRDPPNMQFLCAAMRGFAHDPLVGAPETLTDHICAHLGIQRPPTLEDEHAPSFSGIIESMLSLGCAWALINRIPETETRMRLRSAWLREWSEVVPSYVVIRRSSAIWL